MKKNYVFHCSDSIVPVVQVLDGLYEYNATQHCLSWKIPLIDRMNASGTLEFHVEGVENSNAFYPILVSFASYDLLTDIQVGNMVFSMTFYVFFSFT